MELPTTKIKNIVHGPIFSFGFSEFKMLLDIQVIMTRRELVV